MKYKKKPALYHKKQSEILLSSELFLSIAQDVLNKGLPFRFRATGFSMLPFIKNSDVITILPVKNCTIFIGDVVIVADQYNKKVVVHRVVNRSKDSYLIKGDNCFKFDGFASLNEILGKVVKIERKGKITRLGIGGEKRVIAFLSRNRVCIYLSFLCRKAFIFIKNDLFKKPSL